MAPPVKFADLELDPARFELRRSGRLLKLERIPMELLILLVERNGDLVTREEIVTRLWGNDVFLDTEHGINTAIRKIRQALRDNPEQPRFIQTVTGRGYRFIAGVPRVYEVQGNGHGMLEPPQFSETGDRPIPHADAEKIPGEVNAPTPVPASRSRTFLPIVVGVLVVTALAAAWLLRTPLPPPRIVRAVQLTSDGLEKGQIVSDGLRIYFTERNGEHARLAAVSVSGGEVIPMHTPLQDPHLLSVSPDKSELLVIEHTISAEGPLWLVPVLGGSPRRLAEVKARQASWSADGHELAYVSGNDVYVAKADGTEPRRIPLQNPDPAVWPWLPTWSPDGKRLRFDRYTMNQHTCALWEFTESDGSVHEVFPKSETTAQRCMGIWTLDGKYYLFQSWEDIAAVPGGAPVTDIWAVREGSSFFHKTNRAPVQLTVGPVHYESLTPSPDGRTIFAIGHARPRGELTRYDAKARKFSPYLSGISADGVSFSRDGTWMAYVKYPQGELWRSKPDGSEALQLTFPPLVAYGPSWSPDGKRIALSGQTAGTVWQPYIVSADGSTRSIRPEAAEGRDPSWSADGSSLLLGPVEMSRNLNLRLLDLNSHRLMVIPGSEGMYAPRWSPDGQYISALSATEPGLMRLDWKTQKWTLQAKTDAGWQGWSRDGKYVYFASTGADPGIFRVAVASNRAEKIVALKDPRPTGWVWFSLGPDDEPLLLRDISGGSEIYALQWLAP